MLRSIFLLVAILAATTVSACSPSAARREANEAYYGDRSATLNCRSYGEPLYSGRSVGKVIYDEGGRVQFIDQQTGSLAVVEGECTVIYDRG